MGLWPQGIMWQHTKKSAVCQPDHRGKTWHTKCLHYDQAQQQNVTHHTKYSSTILDSVYLLWTLVLNFFLFFYSWICGVLFKFTFFHLQFPHKFEVGTSYIACNFKIICFFLCFLAHKITAPLTLNYNQSIRKIINSICTKIIDTNVKN